MNLERVVFVDDYMGVGVEVEAEKGNGSERGEDWGWV